MRYMKTLCIGSSLLVVDFFSVLVAIRTLRRMWQINLKSNQNFLAFCQLAFRVGKYI